jgi:acyl-CoA synthetase
VVAMPHERLGEGVCAFLIMNSDDDSLSTAEVASYANDIGMARQKFPEHIIKVDDLPRTPSGKVKKDTLRKQLKEN